MNVKSGKRMPIDVTPSEDGTFVKTGLTDAATNCPMVEFTLTGGLLADERPRYTSHFATCPDADQHRRSRS